MTRNELLELANAFYTGGFTEREIAFARVIAAAEREACAKVCDDAAKEHERNTYDAYDGRYDWQADGANDCAAAIRARKSI